MKKILTVMLALMLFSSLGQMTLANGLNLNSLGARALSMGGAFVGLADDFSTIYWNPAGMSKFQTTYLGFYGVDIIPKQTYLLQVPTPAGILTLVDAKSESKHYLAGMLAYYYPINEDLVAGIGIYTPSGLGSSWNGEDFKLVTNGVSYLWESKIGLITIAPAVSYKVNDMLSVGAALNINYGMFTIKRWAGMIELPSPPYEFNLGQYEDEVNGWGFGATLSVLYQPNDMFSFGFTYRTASKVNFSGDVSISNIGNLGPNFKTTSAVEREVTWPTWLAAGVAYRPMEGLVVTADLQWSDWSTVNVIETFYDDLYWQGLMEAGGGNEFPLRWKDALQIRFGAEYTLKENIALRAGYYWDPSPAPDSTMNILLPSFDFNVFTFGAGYRTNGLQVDLGFELLLGSERYVDYAKYLTDPAYESAMPGYYDMNIFVPCISISYEF